METTDVILRLTRQQALVFFEWLSTIDTDNQKNFTHPAEEKVVWALESQLEAVLTEPFSEDYQKLLLNARRCIVAEETRAKHRMT
jgi:hypothetical protein